MILDIALFAVIGGIVGSRLYHVATHPGDYFFVEGRGPLDTLIEIVAVRNGGVAIFGALIGGGGRGGGLRGQHACAVAAGRAALAVVTFGLGRGGLQATGQGVSPDTRGASGRAYLRALSNAVALVAAGEKQDHRVPAEQTEPASA